MSLSRDEIVQYAARYVAAGEISDFPMDGDLFCLFSRTGHSNGGTAREPQWQFEGYGICRGYHLDEEARPPGKWIWFEYLSLATFPPHVTAIRLQPPHVVTGRFSSQDRSREMRVAKVVPTPGNAPRQTGNGTTQQGEEPLPGNVLRFPLQRRTRKPQRPQADA